VRFRIREIELWNREVDLLLCQLAALIHIPSGLPSRMSELSGLRYSNRNGSKPTVFIHQNRFATLIPKNRAQNEVFRHKGTPRFVPKGRISQALASFLLYVRSTQLLFISTWHQADHWTGTFFAGNSKNGSIYWTEFWSQSVEASCCGLDSI
jgi:hypothetical protein